MYVCHKPIFDLTNNLACGKVIAECRWIRQNWKAILTAESMTTSATFGTISSYFSCRFVIFKYNKYYIHAFVNKKNKLIKIMVGGFFKFFRFLKPSLVLPSCFAAVDKKFRFPASTIVIKEKVSGITWTVGLRRFGEDEFALHGV